MNEDVLEALDVFWPEQSPALTETLDAIRFKSGQRSVVRFLRRLAIMEHATTTIQMED